MVVCYLILWLITVFISLVEKLWCLMHSCRHQHKSALFIGYLTHNLVIIKLLLPSTSHLMSSCLILICRIIIISEGLSFITVNYTGQPFRGGWRSHQWISSGFIVDQENPNRLVNLSYRNDILCNSWSAHFTFGNSVVPSERQYIAFQ